MEAAKISSLLALSLVSAPFSLSSKEPLGPNLDTPSIRASHRKMGHMLSTPTVLNPMGMYVGELQERWQFPSDHLPIGMTYGKTHIGSWNVLDAAYMDWVLQNSQGLSRSQIVDEHIYLDGTKLTRRDLHVADMVVEMLTHPTHPKALLSLQETSRPFIKHLLMKLPENYKVVNQHGNAMIFDTNMFDLVYAREVFGVFSKEPKRSFQEITLREKNSQEELKLINVHLPGDPNGPSRFEFGQYLSKIRDLGVPSIAMGDMNFNEIEMRDACLKGERSEFQIYSPYCTNISVGTSEHPFTSKAIDHFIVSGKKEVQIQSPEEVWIGLKETYQLLNGEVHATSGRTPISDAQII